MTSSPEVNKRTDTNDDVYNLIWFTEASLSNAALLDGHISEALRDGDQELADFFRKAQRVSRKGGDPGKRLLASRMQAPD